MTDGEVGNHLFKHSNDWKTPFKIRIDEGFVDAEEQVVIVRVEDRAGKGGIWKRVWIAHED